MTGSANCGIGRIFSAIFSADPRSPERSIEVGIGLVEDLAEGFKTRPGKYPDFFKSSAMAANGTIARIPSTAIMIQIPGVNRITGGIVPVGSFCTPDCFMEEMFSRLRFPAQGANWQGVPRDVIEALHRD
jgi:hypothetical protein